MFGSMVIQDMQSGIATSLYLLCCILRIVKIKDLANTIAVALFYPLEAFTKVAGGRVNGHIPDHGFTSERQESSNGSLSKGDSGCSTVYLLHSSSSSGFLPQDVITQNDCSSSNLTVR